MKSLERYVGQTLDEKYRLERLLGQGGMGAVYLATHLGTDRYVALKLIAPQFMLNPEFVERFKREARAAGRLRHPNVVDVTDFGFSVAGGERVAYLVMEYLDGCTLGDVLAEETRLPLYWMVDILEQVCSAVYAAHGQGIVHRDLKPDNIWLEPNDLGGYRVKVLDFGIAKLAEVSVTLPEVPDAPQGVDETPTLRLSKPAPGLAAAAAAAESELSKTPPSPIVNLESDTLVRSFQSEERAGAVTEIDNGERTQLIDRQSRHTASVAQRSTGGSATGATSALTRVGAILGTPFYMSPEQCRGESLDARSDIYSLGVIAYQMLSGKPPFTGDTASVIRAHNESQATPVRELNGKVPQRVSRVIMSALEKDPAARPQTAMAFANAIRANADGLGALYRRAFALYSEYFPKFLKLSLLAHIPVIVATLMLVALQMADPFLSKLTTVAIGAPIVLLTMAAQFVTASTISGVTAIIVTQLAVAPMKPVELRAAFNILRHRWRPFLRTGIRVSLRIILGYILLIIPGIVMTVRYLLWAPVVLMEGLEKKSALKRARSLAARSWKTIIFAMLVQLLVPAIMGGIIGSLTGSTTLGKATVHKATMHVTVAPQLSNLANIFVLPLLAIVPALLYLKMRQLGGETLTGIMAQIGDVGGARSRWQQRMRSRLSANTPQKAGP